MDLLKKPSRKGVDLMRGEKKRKKDKKVKILEWLISRTCDYKTRTFFVDNQFQRAGDSLNQIVVPSSSLITSIEMPKYKNIVVPGYRSDET